LVAALACRNEGSRLFGKPLQRLDTETTILDQILNAVSKFPVIEDVCLGISEDSANLIFETHAKERGLPYIVGSRTDVLERLIQCGRHVGATDVFRVTTECPFFHYEKLMPAWNLHVSSNADITVCDYLPDGLGFEIYTMEALARSHREGTDADRSEYFSNFARRNRDLFKTNVLMPDEQLKRLDLRLTVDNPEDLIVCRAVFQALIDYVPLIPLSRIIDYLDNHSELQNLVARFVVPEPVWPMTATSTDPSGQ
jgi:spore coat polysaccharide biosynthesis protein SpsF